MPRGERINPSGVHTPQANYSHVTRVGNTLYISGQLGLDPDGKLVGPGDAAAQAEQAYRNIQTIVEHCGGSLDDVKVGQTIVASTDSLAADAFGWDNLLERKSETLPAYFAKSQARKLGDPAWRNHSVKEVQVG